MALTPTQLNTKSRATAPGPRPADELIHTSTFGRLNHFPNMGIQPKRFHSGQLIMLERGLYRVITSETVAYDVYMGPRCALTNAEAAGSTSLELKNVEDGVTSIPAGTRILIGGRESNEPLEVVTSSTTTSISSKTGTVNLAGVAATANLKMIGTSAGDYSTKTITISDGTNTVVFTGNGSSTAAAKTTDTAYTFGSQSISAAATAATRVQAAIALAKSNGDLEVTAAVASSVNVNLTQDNVGKSGNTTIATTILSAKMGIDQFTGGINSSPLVKAFKAGAVATILFAPNGFESAFRSIVDLEPENKDDETEGLAYVVPCVPAMPAYIGRDGSTNVGVDSDETTVANGVDNGGADKNYVNMGQGLHNQTGADVHATASDYADVGYAFGNSHRVRVGLTSPKIFIDQPAGTRMFFASESNQMSFSKTGFIDAHVSPEWEPNNTFGLWIGVGERSLPQFKLLVDNGLDIVNPRVRLIGVKYLVKPVGEREVKRMIQRSGSFNYETIPTANEAVRKVQSNNAPSDGWYQHVKKMRTRSMNRTEWEQSISQVSNTTRNILSGSKGSSYGAEGRGIDPRRDHR